MDNYLALPALFRSRKRRRSHAAIITKNRVEYVFVALLWLGPDRRIARVLVKREGEWTKKPQLNRRTALRRWRRQSYA
jgi:hypothetical protein